MSARTGRSFVELEPEVDPTGETLHRRLRDGRERAKETSGHGKSVLGTARQDRALLVQPFDTRSLTLTGEATRIVPSVGPIGFPANVAASENGVLAYRPDPRRELPTRLIWYDRAPERASGRFEGVSRGAPDPPGLELVFSTDAVAGGHGRNAQELVAYATLGGQKPMDVVISATSRAAASLGLADRIGTISKGMEADIIALDGNPLANPAALDRVAFVMRAGRVFKNEPARAGGGS